MDVIETRHTNLLALIRALELKGITKRKDQAQRLGGLGSSYLSQLIRGKKMGEDVARKIEGEAGQARGWMDQNHSSLAQDSLPTVVDPPTIEGLMEEMRPRLQRAPPHIRDLIGQSLLRYANHPEDGRSIAQAILALLEPYA